MNGPNSIDMELSQRNAATNNHQQGDLSIAMNRHKAASHIAKAIILLLLGCASFAQTQQAPETLQKIQQMQQAFARNKRQLHSYQWIETTTLTIDGKQRSPKQSICKYAPDGTLQKTPLGPEEKSQGRKGGPLLGGLIRRSIAKKKKDEVKDKMAQVHVLAGMYLPFDWAKFKEALDAGRVDVKLDGTDDDIVTVNDYAKKGDQLRLTLNGSTMQVEQITVKTYFEKPKDALSANMQFSRIGDGTTYPGVTTIKAPLKKLSITTVESDFSKAAN
jgi:hypothetical protein